VERAKGRKLWGVPRRIVYAVGLVSAWRLVAAGKYEDACEWIDRALGAYDFRRDGAPVRAQIMKALISWNLKEYDVVFLAVRSAVGRIDRLLLKENSHKWRSELMYLKYYSWTLLYFSEKNGATVPWARFADLDPDLCLKVDIAAVRNSTKRMFPVDPRMFAANSA
jgi:hypothetical protein